MHQARRASLPPRCMRRPTDDRIMHFGHPTVWCSIAPPPDRQGLPHARSDHVHQCRAAQPPQRRRAPRRGACHRPLRRPRRERRVVGCRRPPLHRLRRRHRGAQHRPSPSQGDGGGDRTAGELHPHRVSGRRLRALCRARRAPERAGAVPRRRENRAFHHRRRSGRERGEDRPRRHRPPGGDRLCRRVSRPHPADLGADRQGGALQARLRPAGRRGLPSCPSRSRSRA